MLEAKSKAQKITQYVLHILMIATACTNTPVGTLCAVLLVGGYSALGLLFVFGIVQMQKDDDLYKQILNKLSPNVYTVSDVFKRYGLRILQLIILFYFGAVWTATASLFMLVTMFIMIDYSTDFGRIAVEHHAAKQAKEKQTNDLKEIFHDIV
jgi:hypothetical protein